MIFGEEDFPAISKGVYVQWSEYNHPIFNEELNEEYLYHFTKIETLEKITRSESLRASPFEKMNDPTEGYESNRHSVCGKHEDNDDPEINKKLHDSRRLGQKIADDVRRKAHVLCFCEDGIEKCGIIRKGFAIPQMWSHYGSSQEGVCIVFSKQKLIDAVRYKFPDSVHKSVVYNTADASGATIKLNPEKIMLMGESEFRKECIKASPYLFWFYKDDGWRYEQEYRIVIPEPANDFSLIPIKNSVVGICLGARFPSESLDDIRKFKDFFDIGNEKTPKIQWDKGIGYPTGIEFKS